MRRLTLLVMIAVVLAGCAPAPVEPPPTATAVPPTNTPLPPTATSIPPTSTPNPDAERILMEFSEAINNQENKAALTLFTEDARVLSPDGYSSEGKDEIEAWLKVEIQDYEDFFKFSEFEVEGDDVTWVVFLRDVGGNHLCVGNATIQDGRISFFSIRECHDA